MIAGSVTRRRVVSGQRPADPRGLLERWVEVAQRRRDDQVDIGHQEQGADEDHAGKRVDVERPGLIVDTNEAQHAAQYAIKQTCLWRQQENPAHGAGDRRHQERHDGQKIRDPADLRVGALVQPGEQRADHQGAERAGTNEDGRIRQHPGQAWISHGVRKRLRVDLAVHHERLDDDRGQRIEDERADHQHQQHGDDTKRRGPETDRQRRPGQR